MKLHELDEKELQARYQRSVRGRHPNKQPQQESTAYQTTDRHPQRSQRTVRISAGPVILCVLGVVAVVLLVVFVKMVTGGEEEAAQTGKIAKTYTQEEVDVLIAEAIQNAQIQETGEVLEGIKQNLTEGMAVAKALRPYYPNEVVVATGGKIRFFPVDETLPKNTYREENLVRLETGELQYQENGQTLTRKGIDVSYHQGVIDWQQVASDGVEFAILRVGLRGYGTGKVVVDEQFENNIKGALANGIEVGVYFYSHSITIEEAQEEAQVVMDQIAPYKIAGPVVYDPEKVADSRTSNLTMEERTAMSVAFCEKVKEAGYRPMIYLNLDTAFSILDLKQLEAYDKWLAHYTTEMYYPYEYKMWQYSESGTVKGIDGAVDLNISFESWD